MDTMEKPKHTASHTPHCKSWAVTWGFQEQFTVIGKE